MGGAAAGASSLASMGFTAAASVMKGEGEQAADDYKAASLERAAEYGKVSATQTSGQLTERLNQTLGNIDAVRAAAGTDPSSPTGAAVRDYAERLGTRQRDITVNNILEQSRQEESDAAYMRAAGKNALMMGYVGAAAGAAQTASKTDWTQFGNSLAALGG